MTIVIVASHGKYCTTAENIRVVKEAIATESPVLCWWYDISGVRFEETFVFIEAPAAIYTESDVP